MFKFISHSENETEELGEKVAKKLHGGAVIAFFGGLGMGKTAFTRGFAKGLGIKGRVQSPTFTLVNVYEGETPLYHFDMYNISSWEELYSCGFFDYVDMGGVIAAEWSENIENALPEDCTIRVSISHGEKENERIIEIEGFGKYENFSC